MLRRDGANRAIGVAHFTTLIAVTLVSARALGAAPPAGEAVRIEYQTSDAHSADCPAEEAFVASLRARVAFVRAASREEPARAFIVRVRAKGAQYAGELLVREVDGAESRRHVEGATCGDVASALALVAALAIDPSAAAPPSESPPPTPPTGPTAAPTSAPTSAPTAAPTTAPTATPIASKAAEPARIETIAPASMPEETARFRIGVGGDASINGGIAPSTLLGFRAFVDVARERRGGFLGSMRAAIEHATTGDIDVQGGGARFTWTTFTLDFCPVRESRSFLRIAPCARVEGGALAAEGTRVVPPRSDLRVWVALDALLRIDAILPGPFFLGAALGLRAPLLRDRFFFEPDVTIYRPPAVGWLANVGGGVTFP